jgi:hypothetical protein
MGSNPTPRAYIGILYKIKKDTSVIDLIQINDNKFRLNSQWYPDGVNRRD